MLLLNWYNVNLLLNLLKFVSSFVGGPNVRLRVRFFNPFLAIAYNYFPPKKTPKTYVFRIIRLGCFLVDVSENLCVRELIVR